MKRQQTVTTLLMIFSSALHAAEPSIYFVKKGDTLSTIAQSEIGSPVYRRRGSLQKLLNYNVGLNLRDIIYPGQALIVGYHERQNQLTSEPPQSDRTVASETSTSLGYSSAAPEVSPEKNAPMTATPTMATKQEDPEIPHQAELSLGFGMTTLSAKDPQSGTSAGINSGSDVNLMASWKQDWTESFATLFKGGVRSVSFQPSTNSSKEISGQAKTLTSLGFEAEKSLSPTLRFSFGVNYANELFMHGISTGVVTIDAVPTPSANIGVVYQVFESGKTALGIKGQGDYYFSTSTDGYSVSSGSAFQGGLYIVRKYGHKKSVELDFIYRDRSQNTSALNFHETNFLGNLIFSVPLFEEDLSK